MEKGMSQLACRVLLEVVWQKGWLLAGSGLSGCFSKGFVLFCLWGGGGGGGR